ncbi:hypothetical protein PBI_SPORTO_44 [Arthrobacter phage Sporto]|nr:hypothetical protein PBI_SPORTO_44 [Arthrobacter phage Sporto]
MIKKTIKFKDYDDKEQVEDFHFNLSKGELVMMEMAAVDSETEGLSDKIERLMKSRSGKEIVDVFKDIMSLSYGVKTSDGRFMKEDADGRPLAVKFRSTGAYSELAFELATDAKAGSDFINGLMPQNMRDEVRKEVQERAGRQAEWLRETEAKAGAHIAPRVPQDFQKKAEPTLQVLPAPVDEDLSSLSKEDLLARLQQK